ncbi:hypothetical protein EV424DRAFT_1275102, partial [Suillus variegatus]
HNAVSMDILSSPISKGGKNILNLQDLIELKWLKGLLALTLERPPWAFFANMIIDKAMQNSPIVRQNAKISTFLQTWDPSLKNLPTHLKHILKVTKRHNVRWEAITIEPTVACQLPIWFHIG